MNYQSSPAIFTVATSLKTKILCLFRSATPEQELGKLPLGSRPAKRRLTGGVESLRAIPWIFARTQNRLMLPAPLGAGTALQKVVEDGKQSELEACAAIAILLDASRHAEMVFAKADLWLAEYYDQRLVDKNTVAVRVKSYAICKKKTSKWCWRLPTIPI